jgi:hypothetical protein
MSEINRCSKDVSFYIFDFLGIDSLLELRKTNKETKARVDEYLECVYFGKIVDLLRKNVSYIFVTYRIFKFLIKLSTIHAARLRSTLLREILGNQLNFIIGKMETAISSRQTIEFGGMSIFNRLKASAKISLLIKSHFGKNNYKDTMKTIMTLTENFYKLWFIISTSDYDSQEYEDYKENQTSVVEFMLSNYIYCSKKTKSVILSRFDTTFHQNFARDFDD